MIPPAPWCRAFETPNGVAHRWCQGSRTPNHVSHKWCRRVGSVSGSSHRWCRLNKTSNASAHRWCQSLATSNPATHRKGTRRTRREALSWAPDAPFPGRGVSIHPGWQAAARAVLRSWIERSARGRHKPVAEVRPTPPVGCPGICRHDLNPRPESQRPGSGQPSPPKNDHLGPWRYYAGYVEQRESSGSACLQFLRREIRENERRKEIVVLLFQEFWQRE